MEKEIVSNTCSLIFIAKINIFDLLKNMTSKVIISNEIVKELFDKNHAENEIIKNQIENKFIIVKDAKEILDFPLDIGEKSALSLCLENRIKVFLSDDKKARNYANSLGLETIGIIGIILFNLNENIIDKNYAKELINRLIEKNYFMTSELYSNIMKTIEEKD